MAETEQGGLETFSAFISYAKADRETAEEIRDHLESKGFTCWFAPRDVRAGHNYPAEIIRGIERSKVLILVLSDEANASKFVKAEVERAYSKGKPVFPVRIEEVMPSANLELFISTSQWIDAWAGRLGDHMEKLARDIGEYGLEGGDHSPVAPSPRSPFQILWRKARRFGLGRVALGLIGVGVLIMGSLIYQMVSPLFQFTDPDYDGAMRTLAGGRYDISKIEVGDLQIEARYSGDSRWRVNLVTSNPALIYWIEVSRGDVATYYAVDDGEFIKASDPMSGWTVNNAQGATSIAIKFDDGDGLKVGPFSYDVEFDALAASVPSGRSGIAGAQSPDPDTIAELYNEIGIGCHQNIESSPFGIPRLSSYCTINLRLPTDWQNPGAVKMHTPTAIYIGAAAERLEPARLGYSRSTGNTQTLQIFWPPEIEEPLIRLEFTDGSKNDPGPIRKEGKIRQPIDRARLVSTSVSGVDDSNAPVVYLFYLGAQKDHGGSWQLGFPELDRSFFSRTRPTIQFDFDGKGYLKADLRGLGFQTEIT